MNSNIILSFLKRNRYFSLLWASQLMSLLAVNIVNFIMITIVYEKTGSTLAVSFLWVFYFLPALFLGPFSGFFVDIWNRRKILIYTNVLQSLIIGLFLFIGAEIYPIYSIVFLYSLVDEFYGPAQASSIPSLVKKEDLPLANSFFLITSQSALILGMGGSGILMRLFGQKIPIILSSLLLAVAAVAVQFLPKIQSTKRKWTFGFDKFWGEIVQGYSFIRNNKIIFFPLLLTIFFQIFVVVLGVTIPGFSSNILKIKVQDAGPLLIIPLGLGALTGAALMAKKSGTYRKRTLIKYGFLGGFLVLLVFSLVLPFLGWYKTIMAVPLMFLLGISGILIFIPNQTLVQENTPDRLRGRVFGAYGFFTCLATLPCLVFTATIVDIIGIGPFLFIFALILLSGFIFFEKAESYILNKVVIKP